jgi:hypothetical protein
MVSMSIKPEPCSGRSAQIAATSWNGLGSRPPSTTVTAWSRLIHLYDDPAEAFWPAYTADVESRYAGDPRGTRTYVPPGLRAYGGGVRVQDLAKASVDHGGTPARHFPDLQLLRRQAGQVPVSSTVCWTSA